MHSHKHTLDVYRLKANTKYPINTHTHTQSHTHTHTHTHTCRARHKNTSAHADPDTNIEDQINKVVSSTVKIKELVDTLLVYFSVFTPPVKNNILFCQFWILDLEIVQL